MELSRQKYMTFKNMYSFLFYIENINIKNKKSLFYRYYSPVKTVTLVFIVKYSTVHPVLPYDARCSIPM